ncbi:DotU family type IV/VI secretion system protein [Candidatus Poribacteria bacterium]|nr:DotU family type IV/VI secretion system protein [Candidatus Poribacteria bacterium]
MNQNRSEITVILSEFCEEVFSLTLALQASTNLGQANNLDRHTREKLEKMEKTAKALHVSEDDVQEAKFGLAAFIDETIMNSSWDSKGTWRRLTSFYFDMLLAGEEFFGKLEEIRKNPSKAYVLDVYYLCLLLGFKGKLGLNSKRYQDYIDKICKEIQESKPIDSLSPNGGPRRFIDEGRKKTPRWVWATIGVYVIIIGMIGLLKAFR